ncbi:ABC transporter ATP-binding protein [Pseudoalteromonas sp.]|uniref:ABC transporter ATP-binding protein n=1 Tax=Pseudoalteromonas sp. TaxID=53249 RepID=UPI00262C7EFB|nr:ABC transporter ATP-binding protein [Pseudoalteromonas sp.]MCP4588766.1 ABC transporter ATP-binding protein [Pseudoalteromonas sp.]
MHSETSLALLLKRIWKNIRTHRKKQFVLILILMFFASASEILSIGAVIPFLSVIANPESVYSHEYIKPFINYFGFSSPDDLVIPITIFFSVSVLLAGLMRICLLWGEIHYAQAIGADFSCQIYQRALSQNYSVHVSRNSSEVISSISTKTDQVVKTTVIATLKIISSILMVSMITCALVAINPAMTISALIGFCVIYSVIIFLTKNRLYANSRLIAENTSLTVKALQEGLGGIRDILIDGTQKSYCEHFSFADSQRRKSLANNSVIEQTPRYGVESLAMILIAGITLYLVSVEGGVVAMLPMLGALALGAQRMLPMLQQAYRSFASMRGSQTIVVDVLELLEQPIPNNINNVGELPLVFDQSIELKNVTFAYSPDRVMVLKGIDIRIDKGTVVGFIGVTGSGKSTLLDIIMGLLRPSGGLFEVDGIDIEKYSQRAWYSHVAHVPQSIFLSDATIAENIAFGIPRNKIDYGLLQEVSKKAQLNETIDGWKLQYDTVVGERGIKLSGGQRQRIGIARALYKQANILILDEATSALDSNTEKKVIDSILAGGDITIIMVAHRLSTLRDCKCIYEIKDGMVYRKGTPEEMID